MTGGWSWAWWRLPKPCPTLRSFLARLQPALDELLEVAARLEAERGTRCLTHTATWLDRVESTRARLWLLGSVLPRAVASSRAAGRRTPESGIPAWDLGRA